MSQEGRQIARVWIAVGIMTLMWGMAAATTFASTLALTPAEIVDLGLKADANLKVAAFTLDNAKIAYDRSVANNLLGGSPAELRAAEIDWLKAQAGYQGQVADAVISLSKRPSICAEPSLRPRSRGSGSTSPDLNWKEPRSESGLKSPMRMRWSKRSWRWSVASSPTTRRASSWRICASP